MDDTPRQPAPRPVLTGPVGLATRAGRAAVFLPAVAIRWLAVERSLVGWPAGWAWRVLAGRPGHPWPADLALAYLAGGRGHVPRLVDRVSRVTEPDEIRVVRGTVSVDPVNPDDPPPPGMHPSAAGWSIQGFDRQPAVELWLDPPAPDGTRRHLVRPDIHAGNRWPLDLRRAWWEQKADLIRRGLW